MVVSQFSTTQLCSDEFVESAGTVVFHLFTKSLCIVRKAGERLLPKGRRNCGESRQQAALRETLEETGYRALILSVNMSTRAPPTNELPDYPDEPRKFDGIAEPFALTMRHRGDRNLKLIWRHIACVDHRIECDDVHHRDETFESFFFPYMDAIDKLSHEFDKDIVRQAIELVTATYHVEQSENTRL
jgi:8-oxo-dGTP pyrophosphatase MutT (NUDIX family)